MKCGPDGINIFKINWRDPVTVAGLRVHGEAETARKNLEWWETNKHNADAHGEAALFLLGI